MLSDDILYFLVPLTHLLQINSGGVTLLEGNCLNPQKFISNSSRDPKTPG